MNDIIKSLIKRKSVRQFTDRLVDKSVKDLIVNSALNAPTAGNQILYTILDIEDQYIKEKLAIYCDNQPFIAKAPYVLIFLADCKKWYDAYSYAGAEPRVPGVGDIILACEDALIAAQNSVIAAESLGLGSCYIGDILENREKVVNLLNLDEYVFPVTMVVYGYPTESQLKRDKPKRFDPEFIVQKNVYKPLSKDRLEKMFKLQSNKENYNFEDEISKFCKRKYMSDFSIEMNRSAEEYLKVFFRD